MLVWIQDPASCWWCPGLIQIKGMHIWRAGLGIFFLLHLGYIPQPEMRAMPVVSGSNAFTRETEQDETKGSRLSACHVPDRSPPWWEVCRVVLTVAWWSKGHYCHAFAEEKTEAHEGCVLSRELKPTWGSSWRSGSLQLAPAVPQAEQPQERWDRDIWEFSGQRMMVLA